MAKVTLTFHLPEDEWALENARKGDNYFLALRDHDEWLRNQIKHEAAPKEQIKGLQAARDAFLAYLNEEGIQLDR